MNLPPEIKKHIDERLQTTPPEGQECNLKVGDRVIFTNEFGVKFRDNIIIGFSDGKSIPKRPRQFVHYCSERSPEYGAYWFPNSPENFKLQS